MSKSTPVDLLVCTTCRNGQPIEDDSQRPGTLLHRALEQADLPDGVNLRAVECLSNCNQGCSIVLRGGPARWTFVYENLSETDHVDTIIEGVTKYLATEDGLVKWRERPEHFRKNCAVRIPPIGD